MDPHHLDVENLDFGIDACSEFNPFDSTHGILALKAYQQNLYLKYYY